MRKEGYGEGFAGAVIVAGALLSILIQRLAVDDDRAVHLGQLTQRMFEEAMQAPTQQTILDPEDPFQRVMLSCDQQMQMLLTPSPLPGPFGEAQFSAQATVSAREASTPSLRALWSRIRLAIVRVKTSSTNRLDDRSNQCC